MEDTERSLISKRYLISIVLVNIILRTVWIIIMHPKQYADFDWYFTHAVMMARGQGYYWQGHYTAYWPIGWPFILSLVVRIFGAHMMPGLFLNGIFSTLIVMLVYLLSIRVFKSHVVGVAASIGYTLLPSHLIWNSVLGSEESFTFFLLWSIYIYLGTTTGGVRRYVTPVLISGLLLGFASDIRPIGILFPVAVLLYEWIMLRRGFWLGIKRVFLYAVAMFAGIMPVTIRNYRAMHHFILVSTNGGTNLWQGTHTDTGYFWSWLPWINPLLKAKNNEILQNQIGTSYAKHWILTHKMSFIHHGLHKIFGLYMDDVNSIWYTFHVTNPSWTHRMGLFTSFFYYLFMVLALIGLYWLIRTRRNWRVALFPLLWIVYNTAIFMLFPAWDRFRFPLMPLFALFLGLGVVCLIPRLRRKLQPLNG